MSAVGTPAEDTLLWLRRRGIITERQLRAARKLENQREMHPDRFIKATAAVGPGLTDILWRVAIAGENLRQAETALGWPARAGKLVLGIALNRLADHYDANTPNTSQSGPSQ